MTKNISQDYISPLLSLLLFFSVFALFAPAIHFSFLNLDDDLYVYENPFVARGLSLEGISWAFTQMHGGHWHPLTWISHMLDCELFGLNPAGHHATNILLHACNAVLVFHLLQKLFKDIWWAFVIALLFASHPMRIESVVWVAERKDVLSMLFALFSIHAYLYYLEKKSLIRYLLLSFCFITGLLAKPMLVTLPILLFLLDMWPLRRLHLSGKGLTFTNKLAITVYEKLPLLVFSAIMSLLVILAQDSAGGLRSFSSIAFQDRIANIFVSYLAYTAKLFIPQTTAIFYPFQQFSPGVGSGAFLGFLALCALCFRKPLNLPLAFGWSWLLISLLPVIGIIHVGGQSFADRWTYLPHLGLLIGLGWYLHEYFYHRAYLRIGLSVLACTYCIAFSMLEISHWRNTEALFRHTLAVTPDNFLAHTNLGVAFNREGRKQEAYHHFHEAARLKPWYPRALNHLGLVYAEQGDFDRAIENFTKALTGDPTLHVARFNLGLAQQRKGNILLAMKIFMDSMVEGNESEDTKNHLEKLVASSFIGNCLQIRRNISDWNHLDTFYSSHHRYGSYSSEDTIYKTILNSKKCLDGFPRSSH